MIKNKQTHTCERPPFLCVCAYENAAAAARERAAAAAISAPGESLKVLEFGNERRRRGGEWKERRKKDH